jgi:hypothetical protein
MHEPIIHASYPGRPGHYVSLELYLFHDDGRLITDPEQDAFVCHPCYVGLDPTRTEVTIDLPSLLPASLLSDPGAPLRAVGILFGQGNLEDLTLRTADGKEYGGPFRVIVFCLNQEGTPEAPDAPPSLRMTQPIFVFNLERADYS